MKGKQMEIAAMSNSVQSCGGVSQSSFVMISKEDDEDKKTVIIAMSQIWMELLASIIGILWDDLLLEPIMNVGL